MAASKIVRPSIEYIDSYLEALEEYHQEERYMYQDIGKIKANPEDFVDLLNTERGNPHQPYEDWVEPVPETILWLVKDGGYIGSVDIRHRLNWHLEKWGGHVAFIIRPSMRGKGFGKKMLKKAIPFINYLGMDKALITVAPDNEPSIRVVEGCGGILEDETQASEQFPARRRYWLDCT